MRHCTPDELIDVVEGARAEASLPHLAACAACRQQLLELRAVLAEVRDVPVPEPSPAQWARLSARVREAVASEVERSRGARGGRAGKLDSWAAGPGAAGRRGGGSHVRPGGAGRSTDRRLRVAAAAARSASTAGGRSSAACCDRAGPADDAADDPSLGLMFELADGGRSRFGSGAGPGDGRGHP